MDSPPPASSDDASPRRTRVFGPGGGTLMLAFITALWGSTFVIMNLVLKRDVSPALLNFVRFSIGALALAPFARPGWTLWRAGTELGLWLFAGYASQTVGLVYTTPNRSAFITATYVIFVPMLTAFMGGRTSRLVWAAAAAAMIGCVMLSYDGSSPNRGDAWTLVTAMTYAVYIVRLGTLSNRFSALPLAAAQLVPVVILSGIWLVAQPAMPGRLGLFQWSWLIYLGLAATAATTWLQVIGQRTVAPAQAAVIFTLEPVFATIFTYIAIHEMLGFRGMIGAGLILIAAVTSQIPTGNDLHNDDPRGNNP